MTLLIEPVTFHGAAAEGVGQACPRPLCYTSSPVGRLVVAAEGEWGRRGQAGERSGPQLS